MSATQQRDHYELIHDDYERHYYDAESMEYRLRFAFGPLLDGVDLNGKDVADLASGSGHNSRLLRRLFPDIRVTGFDISGPAVRAYQDNLGAPCHQIDLTAPDAPVPVGSFDAAIIIGGLHHCVSALPETLANIHRMLKPGGLLLMWEPNKECWLEGARRLWYRLDPYFDAATEASLSHDGIAADAAALFRPEWHAFGGGPAYFILFNSLVFRMPFGLKRLLAKPLLAFETVFNRIAPKAARPYFLARWRKV